MPAVPFLPTTPTKVPTLLRQENKPKIIDVEQAALTKAASPKPEAMRVDAKILGERTESVSTPAKDTANQTGKLPLTSAPQTPQATRTTTTTTTTTSVTHEGSASSTPVAKDVPTPSEGKGARRKPPGIESALVLKPQDKEVIGTAKEKTPSSVVSKSGGKQNVIEQAARPKVPPGTLDIAAAIDNKVEHSVHATPTRSDTPSKAPWAMTPSIASRPVSPSMSVDGIAKKAAPRTLRVVPTPRTETPPPLSSAGPALPAFSTIRLPSRNPSIASVQVPGTPSSEHISDSVSMTSASASRASSPPPFPGGKVGTAPVRAKTKSQQKKDRQEKAKALEEEKRQADEVASPSVDEPAQEAISSRKKKSKRPTSAPKPKPTPSAAPTRPASPEEKDAPEVETQPSAVQMPEPEPIEEPALEVQVEAPVMTDSFTPASLLSDLRNTSSLLSSCLDTFFRPLAQANTAYKQSQAINAVDLAVSHSLKRNPEVQMAPDQYRTMFAVQKPVRYGGEDRRVWSRGCVSPGGAHLRHLEKELEDRYLQLEQELRAIPEELRFHPSLNPKIPGGSIYTEFPRLNVEGIKRSLDTSEYPSREPNAMEKAVEEGSKKGSFLVGHAELYINEFVMPVSPAKSATRAVNNPRDVAIPHEEGAFDHATISSAQSLDELERVLADAKKITEDREGQLRKLIKKNRKTMGYTH